MKKEFTIEELYKMGFRELKNVKVIKGKKTIRERIKVVKEPCECGK